MVKVRERKKENERERKIEREREKLCDNAFFFYLIVNSLWRSVRSLCN